MFVFEKERVKLRLRNLLRETSFLGVTWLQLHWTNDTLRNDDTYSLYGRISPIASDFMIVTGVAMSEGQNVDRNHGRLDVFPSTLLHAY